MRRLGLKRDTRVPRSVSPASRWGFRLTPGGGVTLRPAFDALTTPEGGVKADAGKQDIKSKVGKNEPFLTFFRTPLPPTFMSMTSPRSGIFSDG